MIHIEKLFKSYGKNQVLSGLDLTVKPGQVSGLVGANGAGKTTLFRSIAGFETFEGDIRWGENNERNTIGFLPTHPPMLSNITGWEYLKLVASARKISHLDFDAQNVFDLPLKRYCHLYSTGMRKKLALTGLLIQRNTVFLLDEPFNGVDLQGNLLMTQIIQRLKALGKTVLIASHILESLLEVCDTIFLLEAGTIGLTADRSQFEEIKPRLHTEDFSDRLSRLSLE